MRQRLTFERRATEVIHRWDSYHVLSPQDPPTPTPITESEEDLSELQVSTRSQSVEA